MKIIYNKYLPPKGFLAINLFGVLFVKNKDRGQLSQTTMNHEKIHSAQIKELLYIVFYVCYIVEWLFRFIQYRNAMKAYYNISFEREAYNNDSNLNYLKQRKCFGQWRKQNEV